MEETIFRNCFTLKFKKSEIENEYQKKRDARLFALNRYIILCLVILNILSTILTLKYTEIETTSFWTLLRFSAIISTSIYAILFFVCFLSKNLKILRWCHYLAYILILFSYANIINTLTYKVKVNSFLIYIISIVEMLIRMCSNVFLIQSFLENFTLNFLTCILLWVTYMPVIDKVFIIISTYSFLIYSTTFIILIGFSYVMEKQQKNTFYFQYSHMKKLEWLTNVLENMNTGFLSIRGDKITYMNSFLQNKLTKIKHSPNKINLSNRTLTEGNIKLYKFSY
jgi:hypothetical protein